MRDQSTRGTRSSGIQRHRAGARAPTAHGAAARWWAASRRAFRAHVARAHAPWQRIIGIIPPKWRTLGAAFWSKINNDWIFNLAGLLAYNFLVALFPILLLLLAGVGAVLGRISPQAQQQLEESIAALLPGDTGTIIVRSIIANLKESVSLLLLVGLGGAFLAGSRLFITLEDCFGIIFRLPSLGFVRQNVMALGLMLLYLLLVSVVFLGALIPNLLSQLLPSRGAAAAPAWPALAARPAVSLVVTLVAVGLTYAFVPNRPLHGKTWREIWRGTVLTAVLLLAYEAFFPWYQSHFVRADNYGSVGAFALVILLFFYYLALILLLGAEVNSWVAGHRATTHNLPSMLHALEADRPPA